MGRAKPIYVLAAVAVLGAIVMPVAFAGAASGPDATVSAKASKKSKKLKRLQRQLSALQRQVDQLREQDGAAPSGPAGGDLTGSYPNPLIAPDAVGDAEIANSAVRVEEIQSNAVTHEEIADAAVSTSEILNGAVQADDIGHFSVGGLQLKGLTAVVGPGVAVNAGTPANAQVTCPVNQKVIGGGFAWQQDEANSIIASAPSDTDPNRTWSVRGMVAAGSNTLYAWANCLAV